MFKNWVICKAEIETQMERTKIWILKGGKRSGRNWKIGIDISTLLIL